nr:Uncharacterized protein conserved in bacteria [Raoultella sp. NCTC 9187]
MATLCCRCCIRAGWWAAWTAKCIRKTGVLEIFSLWLEEGVKVTSGLESGLQRAIDDFARWQEAERVSFGQLPPELFADRRQGWQLEAS